MVFLGNPEYGDNFAPFDGVKFAEVAGAQGAHIEDPKRCRKQMLHALSVDGPVIIECVVDPHELPIPAKVKSPHVKPLAQALRQGTPNRSRIALQMVSDMLDDASLAASPGDVLPDGGPARAASRLVGRLRDRADAKQED